MTTRVGMMLNVGAPASCARAIRIALAIATAAIATSKAAPGRVMRVGIAALLCVLRVEKTALEGDGDHHGVEKQAGADALSWRDATVDGQRLRRDGERGRQRDQRAAGVAPHVRASAFLVQLVGEVLAAAYQSTRRTGRVLTKV